MNAQSLEPPPIGSEPLEIQLDTCIYFFFSKMRGLLTTILLVIVNHFLTQIGVAILHSKM